MHGWQKAGLLAGGLQRVWYMGASFSPQKMCRLWSTITSRGHICPQLPWRLFLFPMPRGKQRIMAATGSCRWSTSPREPRACVGSGIPGHVRRSIPSATRGRLPRASLQLPADFNGVIARDIYVQQSLYLGRSRWIRARNPDVR